MLIRAQEMARYVEDGVLDAGLTGRDWVQENDAQVEPSPISFTPSRASVRCAGCWPCPSRRREDGEDLQGKIIATELVRATERYLNPTASPPRSSSVGARPR
jgi:ATP phosphoribosyltransferase